MAPLTNGSLDVVDDRQGRRVQVVGDGQGSPLVRFPCPHRRIPSCVCWVIFGGTAYSRDLDATVLCDGQGDGHDLNALACLHDSGAYIKTWPFINVLKNMIS